MADKQIHELANAKTTLDDADVFAIDDSAASDVTKKITAANLAAAVAGKLDSDDIAEGSVNKYLTGDEVYSINLQSSVEGAITLTSDHITEGETNLYDQTVSFTGGTNVTIGGTYPDFSITDNSGTGTSDYVDPITTEGDLIVGNSEGAAARLAVGEEDEVLTVVSGVPAWAAAAGGSALTWNVEAISATKAVVVGTDSPLQRLNGSSARILELSTDGASSGDWFHVSWEGTDATSNLTVKSGVAGSTAFVLPSGCEETFVFDGTNWILLRKNNGYTTSYFVNSRGIARDAVAINGGNDTTPGGRYSVQIGQAGSSTTTEGGVAVGYGSSAAGTTSSTFGRNSRSQGDLSSALGAYSYSEGAASVALGYYSRSERNGEVATAIEKAATPHRNKYEVYYYGDTAGATATELLLNAAAAARLSLYDTDHVISFDGKVIAADYTNDKAAKWTINGLIQRHGGTVTLVGTPSVTQDFYSAGMDSCVVAVTADDTNKALALTVTGLADTTIRWTAVLSGPEDIDR